MLFIEVKKMVDENDFIAFIKRVRTDLKNIRDAAIAVKGMQFLRAEQGQVLKGLGQLFFKLDNEVRTELVQMPEATTQIRADAEVIRDKVLEIGEYIRSIDTTTWTDPNKRPAQFQAVKLEISKKLRKVREELGELKKAIEEERAKQEAA